MPDANGGLSDATDPLVDAIKQAYDAYQWHFDLKRFEPTQTKSKVTHSPFDLMQT
ncbi:hypothetical protein FLK61_27435 [Paenalkalicoccus suaedae]|uniref:Uncharacterized protein n=1 Tax=Paenalkalicoccus suaedae TaxID=2592382 RepID=A0A859FCC6_9BACI|nr:hypothetical protein [Paenalkalicoccus suaedae]QKS70488.1 hypothetical protein FLK61_27435 [Paenalkalicoccus suaedae]